MSNTEKKSSALAGNEAVQKTHNKYTSKIEDIVLTDRLDRDLVAYLKPFTASFKDCLMIVSEHSLAGLLTEAMASIYEAIEGCETLPSPLRENVTEVIWVTEMVEILIRTGELKILTPTGSIGGGE